MTTAQQTTRAPSAGRQVAPPQPTKNWLSEIITDVNARPSAMVIEGVPGIGKTSLAASIPGVAIMHDSSEDGITTLKNFGRVPKGVAQFPPVTRWEDAKSILNSLATNEHTLKALALDTLGGFERLCHDYVCRTEFGGVWGDKGFASYQKGPELALGEWRLFLNSLDKLRDERQMSIVWLAHTKVVNFKNPEGPDFDRYMADCNPKTWSITHKWADMVFFANYIVAVDKDGKGKGGSTRMIYTEYHPAYDAKNRQGLPAEIPMGSSGQEAWSNIVNALKAAKES